MSLVSLRVFSLAECFSMDAIISRMLDTVLQIRFGYTRCPIHVQIEAYLAGQVVTKCLKIVNGDCALCTTINTIFLQHHRTLLMLKHKFIGEVDVKPVCVFEQKSVT